MNSDNPCRKNQEFILPSFYVCVNLNLAIYEGNRLAYHVRKIGAKRCEREEGRVEDEVTRLSDE